MTWTVALVSSCDLMNYNIAFCCLRDLLGLKYPESVSQACRFGLWPRESASHATLVNGQEKTITPVGQLCCRLPHLLAISRGLAKRRSAANYIPYALARRWHIRSKQCASWRSLSLQFCGLSERVIIARGEQTNNQSLQLHACRLKTFSLTRWHAASLGLVVKRSAG